MDVKKAIEFLEGEITYWGPTVSKQLKRVPYECELGNPLAVKLYKEIIDLLKQGEAVRRGHKGIKNNKGGIIKIKEAIEFCESFKDCVTSMDIEDGQVEGIEKYNDGINDTVALLQQGEKYRQIWEEISRGKYALMEFDNEGYEKGVKSFKELQQKYFPKEAKQDYPESEE